MTENFYVILDNMSEKYLVALLRVYDALHENVSNNSVNHVVKTSTE